MLTDIRISGRKTPMGIDETPRFSWKIKEAGISGKQTAYQITVVEEDGRHRGDVFWDSGKVDSDQSAHVVYGGNELAPMTIYKVQIRIWDENDFCYEGNARFETGLLDSPWHASWITHQLPSQETACPVFSHPVFTNNKNIEKARLYVTACGVYEAAIDGRKVGDAFLAPGWTAYPKRLQYQTYDVTAHLRDAQAKGRKADLTVTVGNGWYAGYLNGDGDNHFYGNRTSLLAMLVISYDDGTRQRIGTDESWQVSTGVIRSAEIYHGEMQDFTLPLSSWEESYAILFDASGKIGKISAQESEPVRVTERIPAVSIFRTLNGETVIDFGQNMAGLVEVKLPPVSEGKEENTLILRHGEALDKYGNFYSENLRTAKATDIYTYGKDMEEQIVMPHFTYHGFRYVCIEGNCENLTLDRFTACAMHTDMEKTGSFVCSDDKVNRLWKNIEWGQRSNFFDIPTDCPQRDERLGWTGDAQIFAETGSYIYDTSLFFAKYLRDVAAESDEENGVPHLVPNIVGPSVGTAVWGDCATMIPWQMYMSYGDKEALREVYPLMRLWVEYIYRQCGRDVLWLNGFQRGDWLALDNPACRPGLMSGGTDRNLVANVYYAVSTRIMRDAAEALGYREDGAKYAARYEAIVRALNDEFVTKTGRLVSETQTACALLLYFGLIGEDKKDRVLKILEGNLTDNKNHVTTGFVGTAFLCRALSENGRHDLACEVFFNEEYPGWFYSLKMGATTIWERWNSILPNGDFDSSGMNSLNHYSFGTVGSWMVQDIAGIKPLEPGYKKIRIKPMLTKGITWVKASLETIYGTVKCEWHCKSGKITVDVEIPFNTSAELILPEKDEVICLNPGSFHFEYATDTSLEPRQYSFGTLFRDILDNEKSAELFYEMLPDMKGSPMTGFFRTKTIGEMAALSPQSRGFLEQFVEKLNSTCG